MAQRKPHDDDEEFDFIDDQEDDQPETFKFQEKDPDETFEFVGEHPTTPTPTTTKEEPSWWDKLFTAPEFIRKPAAEFATSITTPHIRTPRMEMADPYGEAEATAGFIGGAAQGAAELLSPGNIALTALGGGEATALRSASRLAQLGKLNQARRAIQIARGLEVPTRLAGAGMAYHGGTTLLSPKSTLTQRLVAVPEVAAGILGARSRAYGVGRAIEESPARLKPEATDIPLTEKEGVFSPFEEDILREQPLRPVETPSTDIVSLVRKGEAEAPARNLDSRISSLAPEETSITPSETPPPSGIAGPLVKGQPKTEGTLEAERKLEGMRTGGLELKTSREASKEAIEAEIDKELGITQAEKRAQRKGIPLNPVEEVNAILKGITAPPPANRPSTILVKKDIPKTVNKLLSEGYKFVERTPEGHIRMALHEGEEPEGPQFSRVKPTLNKYEDYGESKTVEEAETRYNEIDADLHEAYVRNDPKAIAHYEQLRDRAENEYLELLKGRRYGSELGRRHDITRQIIRDLQEQAQNGDPEARRIIESEDNETLNREIERRRPFYETPPEELPQFARSQTGKLVIGQNVRRSAGELTTGYSGPLHAIMMREAMQNAIDAVKKLGSSGEIFVRLNDEGMEISDNGGGITKKGLETFFTDLHESGKTTEKGATGGKGVGKASYMLGGEYFRAETVTIENGKKVKYIFEGTPDQLLGEGVQETEIVVPKDTPTGTKVNVKFTPKQKETLYEARAMLGDIQKYSQGLGTKVHASVYESDPGRRPLYTEMPWGKQGGYIAKDAQIEHSKVSVNYPGEVEIKPRTSITLRILNNGMYQYTDWNFYLGEEVPNMPNELVVNVKPEVEEGTTEYPFPVQRESLKDEVKSQVYDLIKDNLVNPIKFKTKAKLKELYDNLHYIPVPGAARKTLLFDPGSRLTPKELTAFATNPVVRNLTKIFDSYINTVLVRLGHYPAWAKKLEGVGFVLDPAMHGIHIPNPTASKDDPKSIILINPFIAAESAMNPTNMALDNITTILHEMAHIGVHESPREIMPMAQEELNDPRVGVFLQTYIKETLAQGGTDLGHGINFIKRLGEIYASAGTRRSLEAADNIERAVSTNLGGFSPEFEELLRLYKESRGRAPTKEDFLSGTGLKSAATGKGEGAISSGNQPTGTGTSKLPTRISLKKDTKDTREAAASLGYQPTGESDPNGSPIWVQEVPEKVGLAEILSTPKSMMSIDLPFLTSAALRQGIGIILSNPKDWAKGWWNAARAYGSKQAADSVLNQISKHPYFRRRETESGKTKPSIAMELGLELSDVGKFSKREEVMQSRIAERIPIFKTIFQPARSNRAYAAFLNTVRAGSLIRFGEQAKLDSRSLLGANIPGRDIETDIVFGKELVDAINTLTGRGKITLEAPRLRVRGKEYISKHILDLQRAGGILARAFFSPRLMFSRFKMLNPATFVNADPFVRKLWVKGLFGAVATWWTIAALAEMASDEVEVSKDPNSADFGKIKIGNTRFDFGAGFQQLLVLLSRVRPEWFKSPVAIPFPPYGEMVEDPGGGLFTSSTSQKTEPLHQRVFPPQDRVDLLKMFLEGKLDPTVKFALDLFNANPNRPFPLADRTLQLAVPMFTNDIKEVMEENPELLPSILISGSIGAGGQTYEGGKPQPAFIPEEYDITIGEN